PLPCHPPPPPHLRSTLFPYTTLFRSKPLDPRTIRYGETLFLAKDGAELLAEEVHWYMDGASVVVKHVGGFESEAEYQVRLTEEIDRKSTRLNSSHVSISYAVFCLKKK